MGAMVVLVKEKDGKWLIEGVREKTARARQLRASQAIGVAGRRLDGESEESGKCPSFRCIAIGPRTKAF